MRQIHDNQKRDIVMFSIATLLSGICWLLVAITLLADFAFLKNSPSLSIMFNIMSIIFFVIGCAFFIYSQHLCSKIRKFKKETKHKLEQLNPESRLEYLSHIKKYDFMNENGKLNNWKGVLYCLQLKIPEYVLTKTIIDELNFEDNRET